MWSVDVGGKEYRSIVEYSISEDALLSSTLKVVAKSGLGFW